MGEALLSSESAISGPPEDHGIAEGSQALPEIPQSCKSTRTEAAPAYDQFSDNAGGFSEKNLIRVCRNIHRERRKMYLSTGGTFGAKLFSPTVLCSSGSVMATTFYLFSFLGLSLFLWAAAFPTVGELMGKHTGIWQLFKAFPFRLVMVHVVLVTAAAFMVCLTPNANLIHSWIQSVAWRVLILILLLTGIGYLFKRIVQPFAGWWNPLGVPSSKALSTTPKVTDGTTGDTLGRVKETGAKYFKDTVSAVNSTWRDAWRQGEQFVADQGVADYVTDTGRRVGNTFAGAKAWADQRSEWLKAKASEVPIPSVSLRGLREAERPGVIAGISYMIWSFLGRAMAEGNVFLVFSIGCDCIFCALAFLGCITTPEAFNFLITFTQPIILKFDEWQRQKGHFSVTQTRYDRADGAFQGVLTWVDWQSRVQRFLFGPCSDSSSPLADYSLSLEGGPHGELITRKGESSYRVRMRAVPEWGGWNVVDFEILQGRSADFGGAVAVNEALEIKIANLTLEAPPVRNVTVALPCFGVPEHKVGRHSESDIVSSTYSCQVQVRGPTCHPLRSPLRLKVSPRESVGLATESLVSLEVIRLAASMDPPRGRGPALTLVCLGDDYKWTEAVDFVSSLWALRVLPQNALPVVVLLPRDGWTFDDDHCQALTRVLSAGNVTAAIGLGQANRGLFALLNHYRRETSGLRNLILYQPLLNQGELRYWLQNGWLPEYQPRITVYCDSHNASKPSVDGKFVGDYTREELDSSMRSDGCFDAVDFVALASSSRGEQHGNGFWTHRQKKAPSHKALQDIQSVLADGSSASERKGKTLEQRPHMAENVFLVS